MPSRMVTWPVTPKGQGHDPNIFEAPYLRNCARWTHGHIGTPMGSCPPRVEWSRDWVRSHYCFWLMVKFANKTANIKYKKLTSLHYCVRATMSHIWNSTTQFTRTQSNRTTNWLSASYIIISSWPSLCQKLSQLVEIWQSYAKNDFDCFWDTV